LGLAEVSQRLRDQAADLTVSAHLALTLANGTLIIWRERRDTVTLRARIAG
jgi:hypothetical protein